MDFFKGRKLVIATMHGKELVISPILQESLGVEVIVPEGFDTDIYGTFSGEIERTADPIEAARLKCIAACKQTGATLAVASEGSFGPHPSLVFVPADDEILLFIDLDNNIEVRAREISTETNFSGIFFTNWQQLELFAKNIHFPSHGLIMRDKKDSTNDMVKGINDWQTLQDKFVSYLAKYGGAFVETDMRAMLNPTRMTVIEKATKKLIEKIKNICPKCSFPGYDVINVKQGLPCSLCGLPTRSTLAYLYQCKKCNSRTEVLHPHRKKTEEPTFCDYCNP